MRAALLLLALIAAPQRPGFLGVGFFIHSDATSQWLVVHLIVPDSPAAGSGLEPGDVVTAIDGKPLKFATTSTCSINSRACDRASAFSSP